MASQASAPACACTQVCACMHVLWDGVGNLRTIPRSLSSMLFRTFHCRHSKAAAPSLAWLCAEQAGDAGLSSNVSGRAGNACQSEVRCVPRQAVRVLFEVVEVDCYALPAIAYFFHPSLEGQASLFFRAFFLTVIDYPSPAAHLGGY